MPIEHLHRNQKDSIPSSTPLTDVDVDGVVSSPCHLFVRFSHGQQTDIPDSLPPTYHLPSRCFFELRAYLTCMIHPCISLPRQLQACTALIILPYPGTPARTDNNHSNYATRLTNSAFSDRHRILVTFFLEASSILVCNALAIWPPSDNLTHRQTTKLELRRPHHLFFILSDGSLATTRLIY